jgi:hypothetical protein
MPRTAGLGPAIECPSPAREADGYDTPVPRLSVVVPTRDEAGNVDEADLLSTTITVHGRPVQLTASVGLATAVPTEGAGPPTCSASRRRRCTTRSGASTAAPSGWPPTASPAPASRRTARRPHPLVGSTRLDLRRRQDGPLRAGKPV